MVSKEVQGAVDEIRRDSDIISAMRKADELRDKQMRDLKSQIADLQAGKKLSDDDKQALIDAVNASLATNRMVASAVPANTDGASAGGSNGASQPGGGGLIPPVGEEGHPTEAPTSGDVLAVNGPANHPAGGSAPLMPNLAFNPDPTGARGAGDAGQPNQPAAIETAGGFVVAGGGSTQRAPGSRPESPSSSLVVPLDPDAKGPASTADEIKSGLGDSSQNALLGADGRPVSEGPGMVNAEPSQYAKDEAQRLADLQAKEREARAANPLNLAEPGTPQAGSPDAEKAAQQRRQDEQRAAVDQQRKQDDAEQGKPAPGTPGPDPVSGPASSSGDPVRSVGPDGQPLPSTAPQTGATQVGAA